MSSRPRTMAQAFDEWMRLYRRDPASFNPVLTCVRQHARKRPGAPGKLATEYGHECAAILRKLMRGADLKPGKRA